MVRKEPHACAYAGSRSVTNVKKYTSGTSTARPVDSLQQRIDRLESLVTTLASQDQSCNRTRHSEDESNGINNEAVSGSLHGLSEIKHGLGVMDVNEHHSQYRGLTHWSDVFQEARCPSQDFYT